MSIDVMRTARQDPNLGATGREILGEIGQVLTGRGHIRVIMLINE
jgi:hypothetical protein